MSELLGALDLGRVAHDPVVVDEERVGGLHGPHLGHGVPLPVREQRLGEVGHVHSAVPLLDEVREKSLVVGQLGHPGPRSQAGDPAVQLVHLLRQASPEPASGRGGVQQQEAAARQLPAVHLGGHDVRAGLPGQGEDDGQRVVQPHEVHLEEE